MMKTNGKRMSCSLGGMLAGLLLRASCGAGGVAPSAGAGSPESLFSGKTAENLEFGQDRTAGTFRAGFICKKLLARIADASV